MTCDAFRLFSRRLSPLGCFYGVCRRFWRVSLTLVSWCLSYFALHFVFIACVACNFVFVLFCFYFFFMACVAFQLAISACVAYCWFSHDVTKFQTKKLSIQPRFCFHDKLEQLITNFHTNFRFKRVLGFVIEYP